MRAKALRILLSIILLVGASQLPSRAGLVTTMAQTSCAVRVIDQGTVGNAEILVYLMFCSDGSAYMIATVLTEHADGSMTYEIFVQPVF